MSITSQEKEKIFKKFGGNNKDTGSVYSQVALFTKKIAKSTAGPGAPREADRGG